MAHGAPDFSKYRPGSASFPIADLGELAVRLGAITYYDGRGDVVYLDDFTEGLGDWLAGVSGTGASVVTSIDTYLSGGYCAKLITGSESGSSTTILRYFSRPVATRWGLEASISFEASITLVTLLLVRYTGSLMINARIRYDPTKASVEYYDENAVWQTLISSLGFPAGIYHFFPIKVVADWDTGTYVRAMIGDREVSLSGVAMRQDVSVLTPAVAVEVSATGTAGQNAAAYVDNLIVTRDEP